MGFAAGFMGLLVGACGGQTGSINSGGVDGRLPGCVASGETVDLDQRLPVDFTLRELADAVAGEREVPAYRVLLNDDVVPPVEDETRVKVTITYEDKPVPVLECPGRAREPQVPVNVAVEELGSDTRWDFEAFVQGTPQRAAVTALAPTSSQASPADAGGLAALAGPYAIDLLFEPEGLSGSVGDRIDGSYLRMGTACGGHTELAPSEEATGWASSPAALTTALEQLTLSAERDGEQTSVTFNLGELGSLACYSNAAPLGEPSTANSLLPPLRPMLEVQLSASVALGVGQPAFELERGRLSVWQLDACPVQGDDVCYGYQLRGCSDVTGDEVVAALYPDEVVVAASACLYMEGVFGDHATAMGRVEIGADLDAMTGDDVRIEGDRFVWTIGLEGE